MQIIGIRPLEDYYGTEVFYWVEGAPEGLFRTTVDLNIELPESYYAATCDYGHIQLRFGVLTIRGGFLFDGASGPAINGIDNFLAALVHDALYVCVIFGKGSTYTQADAIYRQVAKKQKTNVIRAWVHWTALRMFGWAWRTFCR